jgi:hypothetical protein
MNEILRWATWLLGGLVLLIVAGGLVGLIVAWVIATLRRRM